jgi:autotransporter-associated beta strand protein
MAVNSSWKKRPVSNDYNDAANWTSVVPADPTFTAHFGASHKTNIIVTSGIQVAAWVFAKDAPNYHFFAGPGNYIEFFGDGIVNGAHVKIVSDYDLEFLNASSAGAAKINNASTVLFSNSASAGRATISNDGNGIVNFFGLSNAAHANIHNGVANTPNTCAVNFHSNSSAGSAVITTERGAKVTFADFSDGDHARVITKTGGTVDFSDTSGASGNGLVNIGSIEGAGDYFLGDNTLVVGGNNRSMTVTGHIMDGGASGGTGAALAKVGKGTLTLTNADNNFSGGLFISKGTVFIKVADAAGPGGIFFSDFNQTLKIANQAMRQHHVTDSIIDYNFGDVIDLPGLRFVKGAKVTYDFDHTLTVKSGHVKDTFNEFVSTASNFKAVSDGHGGTKIIARLPHAKSDDHADNFAFKSEVARGADRPSSDSGTHDNNPAAGISANDSDVVSIVDAVLHPYTDPGLWHHDNLFAG